MTLIELWREREIRREGSDTYGEEALEESWREAACMPSQRALFWGREKLLRLWRLPHERGWRGEILIEESPRASLYLKRREEHYLAFSCLTQLYGWWRPQKRSLLEIVSMIISICRWRCWSYSMMIDNLLLYEDGEEHEEGWRKISRRRIARKTNAENGAGGASNRRRRRRKRTRKETEAARLEKLAGWRHVGVWRRRRGETAYEETIVKCLWNIGKASKPSAISKRRNAVNGWRRKKAHVAKTRREEKARRRAEETCEKKYLLTAMRKLLEEAYNTSQKLILLRRRENILLYIFETWRQPEEPRS